MSVWAKFERPIQHAHHAFLVSRPSPSSLRSPFGRIFHSCSALRSRSLSFWPAPIRFLLRSLLSIGNDGYLAFFCKNSPQPKEVLYYRMRYLRSVIMLVSLCRRSAHLSLSHCDWFIVAWSLLICRRKMTSYLIVIGEGRWPENQIGVRAREPSGKQSGADKNRVSASGAVSGCGKNGRSVRTAWSGRSWSENGEVKEENWSLKFRSRVIFLKFRDVTHYRVHYFDPVMRLLIRNLSLQSINRLERERSAEREFV